MIERPAMNDKERAPPVGRVLNGDCTTTLKTFRDEAIDLVVTDPPYLVNYTDRQGRTIANDRGCDSILTAFDDVFRVLKADSFCISFYGWNRVDAFFRAWRRAGFTPVGHIVWHKNYASKTGFLKSRHEQAYLLGTEGGQSRLISARR
jgi:adenine-specific DNA-methyltransferase